MKDDIFVEIIKRINTESFDQSEWEYIDNQADFIEKIKRFEQVFIDEGFSEGRKLGIEEGIYETVKNGIIAGFQNETIKIMTKLSDQQIDAIRIELKRNNNS